MGRSRLVYRSKHKGTLSENSRKEIREAHKRKKAQTQQIEELPSENEYETDRDIPIESEEEEDFEQGVNLLESPKLYIRESEYSTYLAQEHIDQVWQKAYMPVAVGGAGHL